MGKTQAQVPALSELEQSFESHTTLNQVEQGVSYGSATSKTNALTNWASECASLSLSKKIAP